MLVRDDLHSCLILQNYQYHQSGLMINDARAQALQHEMARSVHTWPDEHDGTAELAMN
jgi:hypothetical protein